MRSIDELIADHRPGYSLAQRFYTDDDVYERELERVINRNWIMAGHVSELPEEGDFKLFEVGRESAIIVRGKDGAISAFANVCRHRGSVVCLEARGNTQQFTCPYHGWKYGLDGHLLAARAMPDGFDTESHGLKQVSLEIVHGLILLSFSEAPPSLTNCRKDMAEPMALFNIEGLKVAAQKDYLIPANWKLCIENYQECYHCATAHPEYARLHTLMLHPEQRPRVQQAMLDKMGSCGLKEVNIDFLDSNARPGEIGYGYSRTALFDGYVSGSEDGQALAPLLGNLSDYDGGASDFSFGGFSFLLAYSDHVVAYVFTPVDKNNSKCQIYWLVRGDAQESRDYDVDRLTWLWDVTTQADKTIITNNAKGIHSKYYRPGPFSKMERAESNYVEWLLQELARPLATD